MAYKPPLDEGELYRTNFRAVREWIEKNRGRVKAKANKTVLYSGRDYDLEVVKDLPLADRKEFMGTPMWKRLEQTRKRMGELNVPCDFQTLEDVLKSIRDHPEIIDKDRQVQRFSSAFDCFSNMERLAKLIPNVKAITRESWERLSDIFASNAQGDIRILDGAADDYGKLREDKIFIRKELESLLKNEKLSKAGKALLEKKISEYGAHFDRRYTELIKRLGDEKSRLKKG